MTAVTRATLYGYFETGDVPTSAQFTDLIDSFLSLTNTAQQTVASDVVFSGQIVPTRVSAVDIVAASAQVTNDLNWQTGQGELTMSATAAVTALTTATFVPLSGASTITSGATRFTSAAAQRLLYNGAAVKTFKADLRCMVKRADTGARAVIAIRIGLNGATLARSEMQTTIGTAGGPGFLSTETNIQMVSGDYVEPFITTRQGSAGTLEVHGWTLNVRE